MHSLDPNGGKCVSHFFIYVLVLILCNVEIENIEI